MSTHWSASRAVYRHVGEAVSHALAAAAATAPASTPPSPPPLTLPQLAELALVLGAAGEHAPTVLTALGGALRDASGDGATLGKAAQAALLARGAADAATQAAGAAVLHALGGGPAQLLDGHVQRAVRHRVAMKEYANALALMSAALQRSTAQSGAGGDLRAPAVLPLDTRWLAGLPHGDALNATSALDALVQSGASVLLPRARVAVRLLRDRDVVMQPWDERLAESRFWLRRLTRGVAHPPAEGAAGASPGEAGDPPARQRPPVGFGGGVGPDETVHVRVLSGRKHAAQGAPRFMASWQVAGGQPGAASALLAAQGGVEGGATHAFMACESAWAHVELRLLAQAGWTVVAVGVHEWLAMEPWDRERLLVGALKQ
jgi:hypothetical protein